MKNLVSFLLAAIILTACNHNHKHLQNADRLMEDYPDSALRELEEIDRVTLNRKDSAYYALLITQARIKCGENTESDSLINIAYNYYNIAGASNRQMRTLFYKAWISHRKSELQTSMENAIRSYEQAANNNDSYWIAKTSELISDIYFDVYNYEQSEKFRKIAVCNYALSGRTANNRYALVDLAATYNNMGRFEETLSLLDSLNNLALLSQPLDSALINYIYAINYDALLASGKTDGLIDQIERYKSLTITNEDIVSAAIKESELFFDKNDIEKASQLLYSAIDIAENDRVKIRALYKRYIQALDLKDYEHAALLSDTIIEMQGQIATEILKESVENVRANYYANSAIYEVKKNRSITWILIISFIVFILVVSLLSYIMILRKRERQVKFDAFITEIKELHDRNELTTYHNEKLSNTINDKNAQINILSEQLKIKDSNAKEWQNTKEKLFKERWATFNILTNKYFEALERDKSGGVLLRLMKKEIDRLSKSGDEIEKAVNFYMDNIMSLLREECNFLKEEDFKFLCLIYAGFSVRSICLFTGMSYSNFYVKKSRLQKRIEKAQPNHTKLFIEKL